MTITLTKEYTDGPKARAIPGAFYSREDRAWILKDPTPRGAAVALKMFPILSVTNPELTELRAELSQQVRPFDFAAQFGQPIAAPRVRKQLRMLNSDLYHFQAIDMGFIAAVLDEHGGAYNGSERGLGKTVETCALIDEGDFQRTVIVCPNTAKQSVWAAELALFCPWLEVVVLRNSKTQRERDLGYVQQLIKSGLPFALVVHYEALDIINGPKKVGWKPFGEWDLVVADEAHRIANPKTKMAKALKKIPTKRKLALSGSIIQNHLDELFSPLQWLFPDRYKSKWRDWNDRYLDYVDSGYSRVCVGVKIEMLDQMRDELGRYMVYRRKEDELDLPARTEETRMVDLSTGQRKVYEELVESYFAQLPSGEVVKASDGLALLGRLRQVATGLDLVGEISDSTKLDLAFDLIRDSDEEFVVFGWYKASVYAMAERLEAAGIKTFTVTGDTKARDRADYIERFQTGEGRVFLGTLSTLGESVTLHRASNAIFLDRAWNPSLNTQAADRIYRIGQTKPVTITHIVAKDTVDELRVTPVIADKEALRKLVLGG